MTIESELNGVDEIYQPLMRRAKDDIQEYQEELKKYNSWKNPFHALVRRGIHKNIDQQRNFLQKITADYQTARKGAIANHKP